MKQKTATSMPITTGPDLHLPNHSGDLSAGKVLTTPINDTDPANKKYVDDNAGGTPEGTAVKSTGEAGGTKFLREDGDGTCSWQADNNTQLSQEQVEDYAGALIATGGTKTGITVTYQDATGDMDFEVDHDAATNFVANEHIDWTSTASNFSTSGTAATGVLTVTGNASWTGTATTTGDNSSADTAYVPMVLYNTDATPPAASGFPIGTIYVQYTA